MESEGEAEVNPGNRGSPGPFGSALSRRAALGRLAAIGGIGAASVGGFLYAGGRIGPETLTPARFADRFERVNGRHSGFRRNHAKGVSASGFFTSNGAGVEVSQAAVFRPGSTPVTARFSLSGGMPDASDAAVTVRGLGLLFHLPNGEQWRTAMVNTPVFVHRTPEGFFAGIRATAPVPATGKPDPAAMAAFLAEFPETARAMAIVKRTPPTSSFDNSTFHGLNAFWFTNATGSSVPVRWLVRPKQQVRPASAGHPPGRDYLFDELVARITHGRLQWELLLTVGEAGDPTDDATVAWPPNRRTITVGTLTIDAVQTEAAGNARDVNFDPLVLPAGIAPSDDPLLSARSAAYAASFNRRAGEPSQPSAVDVRSVNDGLR